MVVLMVIFVIVLTTAAHFGSMPSILGSFGILAAVVFVAICCALGWLLGGPGTDTRGVVSLGTAQRNMPRHSWLQVRTSATQRWS